MSVTAIDSSVLLDYYAAKFSGAAASAASTFGASAAAPTAPWTQAAEPQAVSALTQSVLNGGRFIDPSASKLDAPATAASSTDYRNLFALYQGLSALNGVAGQAAATGVSTTQAATYQKAYAAGLAEVQTFLAGKPFGALAFADGASTASQTASVGAPVEHDGYTGAVAVSGDPTQAVPGLAADAKFSLTVKKPAGAPMTVDFDLSQLNGQTPSLANVAAYMNGKLSAAGLATRVSVQKTAGTAQTIQAGGKTVSLGTTSPDQYALKIAGSSLESLSFSAPAATPAVYLAQTSGVTTGTAPDAVQQLLKLDPAQDAGAADRVFGQTLPAGLGAVRATATGPGGSVYVLADVTGATPDGQPIKGAGDLALVRYDSAGQLSYVRTLGAANSASGLALAVSADGSQVAVAGTVTGDLDRGDASSSSATSGFVQVFSGSGDAFYDKRLADGTEPTALAFAGDGSLAVTGATHTDLDTPGAQGVFLQRLSATHATAFDGTDLGYTVAATAAADPGPAGSGAPAGVVALPDGRIATAAVQNGQAVLRVYASPLTAGAQPTSTRDLGDLGGGSLAGLALAADGLLIVAGTSNSGALSAGTTTTGYGGGSEAFVAKVSASLAPSADDRLSYLSASGDATASAVTVSGGQVYVAGRVAGAPDAPGDPASYRSFVTAVDPTTGEVSFSDTVQGADGQAAPTGLAVDASGVSALDALGLPRGAIAYTASQLVTSDTAARAGDSFSVRSGSGVAATVTLEAGDTLASLATKINRATGFAAAASFSSTTGKLTIAPADAGASIILQAGPQGSDLLAALGLQAGVVQQASTARNTANSVPASPYALNLGVGGNVSTSAGAKRAQATLSGALATVQKAYQDLITKPANAASKAAASSPASAYVQGRIANYQLALERLTGS